MKVTIEYEVDELTWGAQEMLNELPDLCSPEDERKALMELFLEDPSMLLHDGDWIFEY